MKSAKSLQTHKTPEARDYGWRLKIDNLKPGEEVGKTLHGINTLKHLRTQSNGETHRKDKARHRLRKDMRIGFHFWLFSGSEQV